MNDSARGPRQQREPDMWEINQSARGPSRDLPRLPATALGANAARGGAVPIVRAPPLPPPPPPPPPPLAALFATALYDYASNDPSHLPFKAGVTLEVLDDQEPWALGLLDGRTGWYPAGYVTKRLSPSSNSESSSYLADAAPPRLAREAAAALQRPAQQEHADALTPRAGSDEDAGGGARKGRAQRHDRSPPRSPSRDGASPRASNRIRASGSRASIARQQAVPAEELSQPPTRASTRPPSPRRGGGSRPESPKGIFGRRASTPVHRRVLPANYVCPYALKHGEANVGAQVVNWASDATGTELPMASATDAGMHEALKSGVVLCELANALRPGIIRRIERKDAPFQMRENISRFLAAAKELGVPNNELFDVPDLFEAKQMRQVRICLYALGRAAHDLAEYKGPCLGKPISHVAGAHKHSSFKVDANNGLWGKSGGAYRPDAGNDARMRSATTTGRPDAPTAETLGLKPRV